MILLNDNTVILKNPKTAGTSLHDCLADFNCAISIFKNKSQTMFPSWFHNRYYGEQEFQIPPPYVNLKHLNKIDKAYVVIREPVDRFMSVCRHLRDYGFMVRMLFKDRLDLVATGEETKIHPIRRWTPELFSTFSKAFQEEYNSITLEEIGNVVLDLPFNQYHKLDFIRIPQNYYLSAEVQAMDYANLNNELSKLMQENNIPQRELTFENVGTKLPTDHFSDELISKIKIAYSEDVEFYQNTFKNKQ